MFQTLSAHNYILEYACSASWLKQDISERESHAAACLVPGRVLN